MPGTTLSEVEKAMTKLWTNRDALERFLAGDFSDIGPEIAAQIDKERLMIYVQVLQVKHYETMSMTFPLTEKLLGEDWDEIVEDYRNICPPTSYRSSRAGEHFKTFVEKHLNEQVKEKFPYLTDLVDYEFSESDMIDFDDTEFDYQSDTCLLQSAEEFAGFKPLVNPALLIRRYQFDLIAIAEKLEEESDELPVDVKPESSTVLVYRDPEDKEIRFLSVGHVAAAIIEKAQEGNSSYGDLAGLAVALNPDQDPQTTLADFMGLVESLQGKHVFIGHRKMSG